jgi:hypothetical protein
MKSMLWFIDMIFGRANRERDAPAYRSDSFGPNPGIALSLLSAPPRIERRVGPARDARNRTVEYSGTRTARGTCPITWGDYSREWRNKSMTALLIVRAILECESRYPEGPAIVDGASTDSAAEFNLLSRLLIWTPRRPPDSRSISYSMPCPRAKR